MAELRRNAPKRASAGPELIVGAGRESAVPNPAKVLFPKPKYTKLDLVRFSLPVAEGALRGAGGRPNVLVRYPNGISGEFFYQKRAPESRPPWIDVVTLSFPSGRTAEEVVPRDAAALAWLANLARSEEHTSELQSRLHLVCRLLLEKKNWADDVRIACPPGIDVFMSGVEYDHG